MPYTITSTVFFGAIIVGLSGGGGGGVGGEERVPSQIRNLWCEYIWVATSPGGGFAPKKI